MRRLLILLRSLFRLTDDEHCWWCGATLGEWHDAKRLCGRLQRRERQESERRYNDAIERVKSAFRKGQTDNAKHGGA